MTISELIQTPEFNFTKLFIDKFSNENTDNELRDLNTEMFLSSLIKFKNFTILYLPNDVIEKLQILYINSYSSISMRVKMLMLGSSNYFQKIESWTEINKNSASYNTGYAGFNAEGDFKKDTNNSTSENFNPLTFLNYFGQDFKNEILDLEKEIQKLLQTIY